MSDGGATVEQELRAAIARLRDAGVESPQLDAQLLMAFALGCSRLDLIAHPERSLSPGQVASFSHALCLRESRYPLSYITGEKEFYGLAMVVSPAVLIPRPETELLVEECIKRVGGSARIADIGTGSGAIAVALAVNLPGAVVYATDTSAEALKVARANAEKHGVADRVSIVQGDLLEPLVEIGAQLDAIVSNPPYIPRSVVDALEPEVRQEPVSALDGGPDGLDAYRRLFADAGRLSPLIAVEIGIEQADSVTQIARDTGWAQIETVRDLAGIERVVIARR